MESEKRRLVKSGNTSFTLALPIDWVRKHKLEKGNEVLLSENESGELVVAAERKSPIERETIYTLKVDGKDPELITLELFQAYIHDYQTIVIEGKELQSKTTHILNEIRSYIGLDVIEQTVHHIIIKNFYTLDKETSPYHLVKKVDRVNRALFNLLNIFFTKGLTKEDLLEASRLKDQNQRLFHLIRKSTLKLFEDLSLMKFIQTSPLQLSKDKIMALHLKNISLLLYSLGRTFFILDNTKKEVVKLKEIFSKVFLNYDHILNAITNKDYSILLKHLKELQLQSPQWERHLHEFDDSLIVEAINNLISCNILLEDIARESLE